jgi:hypothetical protein
MVSACQQEKLQEKNILRKPLWLKDLRQTRPAALFLNPYGQRTYDPTGIRTLILGAKIRFPKPLEDGAETPEVGLEPTMSINDGGLTILCVYHSATLV